MTWRNLKSCILLLQDKFTSWRLRVFMCSSQNFISAKFSCQAVPTCPLDKFSAVNNPFSLCQMPVPLVISLHVSYFTMRQIKLHLCGFVSFFDWWFTRPDCSIGITCLSIHLIPFGTMTATSSWGPNSEEEWFQPLWWMPSSCESNMCSDAEMAFQPWTSLSHRW